MALNWSWNIMIKSWSYTLKLTKLFQFCHIFLSNHILVGDFADWAPVLWILRQFPRIDVLVMVFLSFQQDQWFSWLAIELREWSRLSLLSNGQWYGEASRGEYIYLGENTTNYMTICWQNRSRVMPYPNNYKFFPVRHSRRECLLHGALHIRRF